MHVTIEHNEYTNTYRAYVSAPYGTHASTMRAAARAKMNATACPDYVETYSNGSTMHRPGAWAQHLGTSAEWKTTSRDAKPAKRLFWELVVIPDWSAENCA